MRMHATTLKEFVCNVCRRTQLMRTAAYPNGLMEDEAKIIGWSEVPNGTGWACPFHSRGGTAKLRAVVKKGVS